MNRLTGKNEEEEKKNRLFRIRHEMCGTNDHNLAMHILYSFIIDVTPV